MFLINQSNFARIWANEKWNLEEAMLEAETAANTPPNPDIWDKILQERERAYAEEEARKAEALLHPQEVITLMSMIHDLT